MTPKLSLGKKSQRYLGEGVLGMPVHQTTTTNENQSLISINIINKSLLIYIDWLSQSTKTDNYSPIMQQ